MKTTGNTILITGGSAGIGFEFAKAFDAKGNHVIITGRNAERLQKAAAQLTHVTPIVYDVVDKNATDALVARLEAEFPSLNVVINNAGKASYYHLDGDDNVAELAEEEIVTNYLAIIGLNQKLLPLLKKADEAAIVTVSSIAALVPNHFLPTYAASKAALHSYTQSLRIALGKSTRIKVFEILPPLVDTEFSAEIGGAANGIPPKQVADELVQAFETDTYEVLTGRTADVFNLFLSNPAAALQAMNPGLQLQSA
ncbi:SDR family oxidoreductase [Dyadobacter fermentans]|uniref:Short-chain dehydrogenase/reductase SDR n=1 Tax=Dyadobacter fermentans (strain ATCC 700827 / DSM 18053 / CIP 107007 / KCTC 52180 / NS114) TaxID=471854 RepID=C6W4G9_DYAFD|nr:SDR family NAD(P)-dependent oxidoreductase [Dyadobacter fermentans]ACT94070.1 short-chain dehydrogenase/reductase SDR [Dyadobacter fermentans DSM 18053]